jgi:hypothetical protein
MIYNIEFWDCLKNGCHDDMTMTWLSTVNVTVSQFSKNVDDVTVGHWKLDILDSDMTFLEKKIIKIFNMKTGVFYVNEVVKILINNFMSI